EQVPQPFRTRQRLEVVHKGNRVLAGSNLGMPGANARHNVLIHEGVQLLTQCLHTRAVGEIHAIPLGSGGYIHLKPGRRESNESTPAESGPINDTMGTDRSTCGACTHQAEASSASGKCGNGPCP